MPSESRSLRLYLVRHTEPEGGRTWTILGHKDVPLSKRGTRHSERLAKQFERAPLEAVYCSDLSRAWWFAELVAKSRGLPAYRLEALRELDCGCMDGMKRDEARSEYPEVFEGLRRDPVNYRIPKGETMQELADRVRPVIDDVKAGGHRCVLVVAHAVVNRVVICDALNLPLDFAYRIDQSYGGVNIIEYGGRHPTVHVVNAPSLPAAFAAAWKDI